jgi:hypothetical protein
MLPRGAEFRVPLASTHANSSTSSAPAANFGVENGGKMHPAADDSRIVCTVPDQKPRLVEYLRISIYPSS